MEKNSGVGAVWFNHLLTAGLLDEFRKEDVNEVKKIIRDITGGEVYID